MSVHDISEVGIAKLPGTSGWSKTELLPICMYSNMPVLWSSAFQGKKTNLTKDTKRSC